MQIRLKLFTVKKIYLINSIYKISTADDIQFIIYEFIRFTCLRSTCTAPTATSRFNPKQLGQQQCTCIFDFLRYTKLYEPLKRQQKQQQKQQRLQPITFCFFSGKNGPFLRSKMHIARKSTGLRLVDQRIVRSYRRRKTREF